MQAAASNQANLTVKPRARGAKAPWVLAAPAMIFVSICLLIPLLIMLRLSVSKYDPAEMYLQVFTAENYVKFFTDSFYRQVMWTTLWVSTITTLLCLLGGLPVAYFISRSSSDLLKRLLIIAVVLPLLMGSVVRTAGWIIVLDNGGVLKFLLNRFGLLMDTPLLFTAGAVIAGLTSVLLPFMIITLHSVMESIDPALEEASLSLGATPFTTFRRVVLPLLAPGILAGCVLCFILSMNAYATPVLLGGPQFHMMAPKVYEQVAKSMNWPFGAALAFLLIAVTAILTVASSLAFGRKTRA
jgi:putative spermidine/putrescine transport system permease protein